MAFPPTTQHSPERHIAQLGIVDKLGVDAGPVGRLQHRFLDLLDRFPAEARAEDVCQQQRGSFLLQSEK